MSNTNNDLFITATRKKFLFDSNKGLLSIYDLWDLSLTALDNIAVALDNKVQQAGRKSFIAKRSTSDTESESKLEIVKFVIATKQEEAEAAKVRADKASQKAFLKDLLEKKKLAQLENLPAEEIEKQLAALD